MENNTDNGTTKKLGVLENVDLREVWKDEARNFTPWLSQNLDLLDKKIDIGLVHVDREVPVGDFRADILAKDREDNDVVIENQLEATDHKHLGQVITYAAGATEKGAKTIIWIAKEIRPEFQKAIEWLNKHTDTGIDFYLIKINLLKIGTSAIAPNFSVIVQPDDSDKTRAKRRGEGDLQKYKFWEELIEYANKNYANKEEISFFSGKPSTKHWYVIRIDSRDAQISLVILQRENKIRCELYIPENKELFENLKSQQAHIESDIGFKLYENAKKETKASSLFVVKDFDFSKENDYNIAFEWFIAKAKEFSRVFKKYLQEKSLT